MANNIKELLKLITLRLIIISLNNLYFAKKPLNIYKLILLFFNNKNYKSYFYILT